MIFNMADNLSKALQGSYISATEGQRLMSMTVKSLQDIRTEECYDMFWQRNEEKRKKLEFVDDPSMLRKRKVPVRLEVGSSVSTEERSVKDFYRQIYYEVVDYAIEGIKSRFNQDGHQSLCKLERFALYRQCQSIRV